MLLIQTKKALQKELKSLPKTNRLGLVPTMGALHKGHATLIKIALKENDQVIVSIFVNPTQFNNTEDLEKYPKTLEADLRIIRDIDPEIIVFAPAVEEIYSNKTQSKTYDFKGLDKVMEGAFRPGHFNGVGTVVEALLELTKPDRAYFGEKDYQQLRIIQTLTKIHKLQVEIIGCPIVRETHGLAMSSRNERLDPALREKAGFIYETLQTAKLKFGTDNAIEIQKWVKKEFSEHPDLDLEYFEITDVETLRAIKKNAKDKKYRAFIAVYAADVRLIDNIALN